jgi:CheY-specific phosphatase CheX
VAVIRRPISQRNKEINHNKNATEMARIGMDKKKAISKNLLPLVGIPGQTFGRLSFSFDIENAYYFLNRWT